jgi:hypothetical protein
VLPELYFGHTLASSFFNVKIYLKIK